MPTSDAQPGANSKGGGFRGGPKRWTGQGPAPARHIPWPEIFKHHLSVVEGHQKMIDMVRKHTVPDTGNHRTICEMLDRCHDMFAMTKKVARDFVPPQNGRDMVPIGSSSASMYPGYSPADHIYGDAAKEFGEVVSNVKKSGHVFQSRPDGPEYVVGQAKGSAARRASMSEQACAPKDDKVEKPTEGEANEYFVVDSFPAPAKDKKSKKNKKLSQEEGDGDGVKPSKKTKTSHDGPLPDNVPVIGEEDISEEVDARMKAKEEKRKAKKEKKRKRESEEAAAESVAMPVENGETEVVEKPKKKKSKMDKAIEQENGVNLDGNKRQLDEEEPGRKKKKQKKSKA